MKILLLSHEYPPKSGGAGVVAYTYLKFLKKLGYDVSFVTSTHSKKEHFETKVYFVNQIRVIWPIMYLFFYLKNKELFENSDKIIINDMASVFWVGCFLPEHLINKSICLIHGVEKKLDKPSFFEKVINYEARIRRTFELSNRIISVSEFIRDAFLNQLNNKELKHKVDVLYTPPENQVSGIKKHTDNDLRVLLTVGRFEKEKGFDLMLDTFELLNAKSIFEWRWVIVGDGNYLSEFKSKLSCVIKDKINIVGRLDRESLSAYYSQADVFILLSQLEEAFGLVYVEALAAGVPIVAWNYGGPKEIVLPSINGYLVNDEVEACNAIICSEKLNKYTVRSTWIKFSSLSFEEKLEKLINE